MNRRPFVAAGILLGIGLGGFIDGILLHQIFQLHSMLSAKLPQDNLINIKTSMVWDGIFHLLTWVTTALGVWVLWAEGGKKRKEWSGKVLWGAMIAGWGIFNGVEGIIDHYILQVHHVVEQLGLSIYDHAFIASGVVFTIVGWLLIRKGEKEKVLHHMAPAYKRF